MIGIWDKVLKNEPTKVCGRHSLKNLKGYGLPKADHILSRLSSANFTWSILQYFVLYELLSLHRSVKLKRHISWLKKVMIY